MNNSSFVFIMDGLSGHRISWIYEILDLRESQNSIQFWIRNTKATNEILESRSKELENRLKDNLRMFRSASEIYREIDIAREDGLDSNFVILDGDNWLIHAICRRINIKILVMRPYVTEKTILGFIRFFAKRALILAIYFRDKNNIRCLSITGWKPRFNKSLWVDDDLVLLDLFSDLLHKKSISDPNTVLVPGFITERKNPILALEAISIANSKRQSLLKIHFVGSLDEKVLGDILKFDKECYLIDNKYSKKSEFYLKLKQSRCALLLYNNSGASRILVECLLLGVPVVAFFDKRLVPLAKISKGRLTLVSSKKSEIAQAIDSSIQNADLAPMEPQELINRSLLHFLFSVRSD